MTLAFLRPRAPATIVLGAVLFGLVPGFFACEEEARPVAQAAQPKPAPPPLPPPPTRKKMPRSNDWKRVESLINEQKYDEAQKLVDAIRVAAEKADSGEEWTEALIKETQLQLSLGGYETAVRFLREQRWPQDLLSQVSLELYYANSLVSYLQAYSWEINQRERVESRGPVDLKAWTRDQIYTEAQAAYARLWARRVELSQAPASLLGEVLHPGTYPASVRGTLRDELSYFAVDLLTNTMFWRPAEQSELYRLDLKALIDGSPEPGGGVKLDDTKVHPLARAMAVLDDLEAFHTAAKQPEAALEARIVRIRRLHQAFTDAGERSRILAGLESRLPASRAYPWWSSGMAALAELVRDGDHDLARAHALAAEGQRAYPDSPGGRQCGYVVKLLEAPDLQLQGMSADAPGRRSLLVNHKNLEHVYFRAYPLDLLGRVESSQDYDLLLSQPELMALVRLKKPAAEWKVDLPPTPDYKAHATYVTPPLKGLGLYAIVASIKPDFSEADNRILGANLILTDLVTVTRQQDNQLDVTVVSSSTGQPVAGAAVSLYLQNYSRRHQRIASERTDAEGVAHFKKGDGQSCFVFAQKDSDATVDRSPFYLYRSYQESETRQALIFTDRSIYRPEQKVFYKVVAYRGKVQEGKLQLATRQKITAVLIDANNQEVGQQALTTNDFGTAAGDFAIPGGRLLGQWRIELRGPIGGQTAVRVEEYKRPTFEVSFKDPTEPLRLNKKAVLVGEARYYFGLPVSAGEIHYRVTREPVYPWWWYLFGYTGGGGGQLVQSGVATLGKDGTFQVEFTPAADERQAAGKAGKDLSYRYLVKADLTDEGGETRGAERGFRLGFVSVEATLSLDGGFVRAQGGDVLTVRRQSLDGVGRPGEGRYRIVAIKHPAHAPLPADEVLPETPAGEKPPYRTPGDRLVPRWQPTYSPESMLARFPDGAERHAGKLSHDASGVATVKLPPLPPGAYRVRYETVDDFGTKAEAWHDFIVGGPGELGLPLLVRAEHDRVAVGGKARLLVSSGLTAASGGLPVPVVVELFRAGKLLKRSQHPGTGVIELPITEEDRGGLGIVAWVVRDHQFLTQSLSLNVPWDNKELKVELATFRDRLRPGAHETFRVIVRTASGEALARGMAELLAYMYDRSLDVFAPHSPPNPLSLFPFRGSANPSRASLGVGQVYWLSNRLPSPEPPAQPHGATLVFYDSYGIGGPGSRGMPVTVMARAMRVAAAPGGPPPPPPPPPSAAPAESAPAQPVGGVPAARAEAKADKDSETRAPAGGESVNTTGVAIRSNFAETAFFLPALLTGDDGSATLEFQVPDSVTAWNVWVHALTRDLRSGSVHKETRSVKDLMVRPYLPRFFREADSADLKVMVNNAGDKPLSGALKLEVADADGGADMLALFQIRQATQPFSVPAGGSATVTFPLAAPRRVGVYAFKVVARAGDLSDGELRPLPVLPSRLHLAESRFVTLHDKESRTLSFADLKKNDDPTRVQEKLVVTLDAQLFYTVLKALPYLVSYPYECVEQTLNRFLSTGIVTSLYGQYPAVARMAKEFSERPTQLEKFDAPDPNRRMALEESPWVEEAKGGSAPGERLINVLDGRVARMQRDSALAKLVKAQTGSGGFPWFPGGPPSPFMTLYLMHGFAKASEFGVAVPKDVVSRGWQYLAGHYREHYIACLKKDTCDWEFLTFLNYTATAYPDASWVGDALSLAERQTLLAYSFKHWKQHTPYLKGMLALTLKRMGRKPDAQLVWASVMDSAKTAPDQGVFWAPEERSWLWYSDTIESHAFALRTLMEIDPDNAKRDGLVLWLLINKKLNQWKSTRATAEVIYSLVHYLKREGALGVREDATVTVGPQGELGRDSFVFEPDRYVGKTQLVLTGEKVAQNPAAASQITVEKSSKGNMFASATWHYSTDRLPTQGHGDFFQVERSYFKRQVGADGHELVLKPLAEGETLAPGDEVEVHLSLRSKHAAEYVHLRDPRGAGFEPTSTVSSYKWDLGLVYYEEVRDSGMNFFFESLPAGEYTFKYRIRASLGGKFRVGPATVQSMYAPEFNAFSAGHELRIGQ